ncbi:putative DNA repair protein [Apostichopus japonicus]|uniref:DNA repair protein RAD51 homolog 3 n=1 Tax=Stichopus japonicus TaxID=307972 RepID=A0A2G8KUG6_STIJA|nr:putative DNA repair protein [Apostichopus japonicus]
MTTKDGELSITTEEALEVLATISPSIQRASVNSALSAFELLKRENDSPGIMTFCEEVDDMLGGGVPLAKITEFCGSPGVGKTQLSIQLAVNVQIPEAFGGLQGEAVFIDTEGSFIPQRAADIAQAVEDHCRRVASIQKTELEDQSACLKDFSVEKILSGIHYFRCHNYTELLALVNLLPQFIKDHEKIKLIIIDSIAFHFRHDLDDMALRTRLLNGLAQSLIKMATMYRLAVSPISFATLYKSPSKKEMTVPYQVTIAGIRSMEQEQNETSTKNDASGSSGGVNPRKRRRAQSQENG